MYVVGFVIPVQSMKLEDYRDWARKTSLLLKEYGCLEVVDAVEDNVPDGTHTDFRKAVDAREDEMIVFSWQKWPSKEAVEVVEKAMSEDARFDPPGGVPFDQRRLIMGCFNPLFDSQ